MIRQFLLVSTFFVLALGCSTPKTFRKLTESESSAIKKYRKQILGTKPIVIVEAAIAQGWHEFMGKKGHFIGMNSFGASAPYQELYQQFGITTDNIIKECEKYIEDKGWKCWAIFNLYHTSTVPFYKSHNKGQNYRTIIRTYKCGFDISQPSRIDKKKSSNDFKFRIYQNGNWRNSIFVKRLPSQFVNFNPPAFIAPSGTLGENNSLRSLKDKMDSNS